MNAFAGEDCAGYSGLAEYRGLNSHLGWSSRSPLAAWLAESRPFITQQLDAGRPVSGGGGPNRFHHAETDLASR
jgi:hypothetical protein